MIVKLKIPTNLFILIACSTIPLYHTIIFPAELITLSTQLENLSREPLQTTAHRTISVQAHALPAAPVNELHFPATLCVTHQLNIFALQNTPIIFKQESHTVEVLQPLVAWQGMTLGDFMQPALTDFTLLIKAGYIPPNQITFIRTLTRNSALEQYEEQLKKSFNRDTLDRLTTFMIGGGDASCGYHTIKNLITLKNAIIKNTQAIHTLLNMYEINKLFGFSRARALLNLSGNGKWRHIILNAMGKKEYPSIEGSDPNILRDSNLPLADSSGEWLSLYGLQLLIQTIKLSPDDLPANIQWCWFAPPGYNHSERIKAMNKEFTAYIALCICLDSPVLQPGVPLHWFGVVVSKSFSKTQIIIVDSKNVPRFDNELVKDIINAATGISSKNIVERMHKREFDTLVQEKYQKIYDYLSAGNSKQEIQKIASTGISLPDFDLNKVYDIDKEARGLIVQQPQIEKKALVHELTKKLEKTNKKLVPQISATIDQYFTPPFLRESTLT